MINSNTTLDAPTQLRLKGTNKVYYRAARYGAFPVANGKKICRCLLDGLVAMLCSPSQVCINRRVHVGVPTVALEMKSQQWLNQTASSCPTESTKTHGCTHELRETPSIWYDLFNIPPIDLLLRACLNQLFGPSIFRITSTALLVAHEGTRWLSHQHDD